MAGVRDRMARNTTSATRFKAVADAYVANPNMSGMNPWLLAFMAQAGGSPTTSNYCSVAVARTDAFVREEEIRIAGNTNPEIARNSYLYISEILGSAMMVYDWCRSHMTPAQRERWKNWGNQAVFNVWNPTQARWGNRAAPWSGWSINNPGNNYFYSFIDATMMLGLATHGENDMAPQWLEKFRIEKVENQMLPHFTNQLVGGGSREGTGYGTALMNLWRTYDWWQRSTEEPLANRTPHTLASMAWMLHAIVPTGDRILPTGDHSRDSEALFFDYHRTYLLELMALNPEDRLSGVAKTMLGQVSVREMGYHPQKVFDLLYDVTPIAARPLNSLSTAYWASGTGGFSMRNDWTTASAYANFICGPIDESHAHNDQGSFVLFKGSWLAYDANIDGHSGILQEQRYHNSVRFQQGTNHLEPRRSGRCNMGALANTTNWAYAMAQITPMYAASAGVVKSEREFVFIKPSTFVVYDRAQTQNAGIQRIFTMNFPSSPTINGDTVTLVRGSNRFDMKRILPAAADTSVTLWRNANSADFFADDTAARLDVVGSGSDSRSEFLHVIGLDGSVAGAVASNSGGQSGVDISLADGRRAIVRFSQNGTGGTVEIRSSNGMVIETTTLPTSIQAPPLFVN